MEPWHLAAVTILAAAYLIIYFASYRPRRLATIAITLLLGAIIMENTALMIHHFSHQNIAYKPFITAARLALALAVLLLLVIVVRSRVV